MGRQRESKVDYWLRPDKLELLKCYARDFTLADIARKIGISYKVFCEWRKKYPAINDAIEEGKETVDYQVENALLKTALGGYKVKEVTSCEKNNQIKNKHRVNTVMIEVFLKLMFLKSNHLNDDCNHTCHQCHRPGKHRFSLH